MSLIGVIDQYRAVLSRFGQVVDFDISGLDRLGIPVTSCSLAVDGAFRHHGNGYGATEEAARVSGLGELAEGVVSAVGLERLRAESRSASYAELVAAEGRDRVADPRTLVLPAGTAYDGVDAAGLAAGHPGADRGDRVAAGGVRGQRAR